MDIRTLTPTICSLMGIEPPDSSVDVVQEGLISALGRNGISGISKCLVFAPDAISKEIHDKYRSYFTDLNRIVNHSEYLDSIEPPWTPVCFASMFSGALPEVHGIQKYERPILSIDTIFDAMVRSGKKAAIITTQNSSIDLIFRNRDIDYYIQHNDSQVFEKTVSVLNENKHDFLVVYNKEYDDLLHKTHPFSRECLEALKHHNETFVRLHETVKIEWQIHDWLMVYAHDHGAHYNEADGVGTHGRNIPEDMKLINHYVFC
ncbi:hypothetical protein ACFLXY_11010 [Chloroflexota bacterium]